MTDKLQRTVAVLREASRYISHASDCPFDVRSDNPESDYCTCGVEAFKARARAVLAEAA